MIPSRAELARIGYDNARAELGCRPSELSDEAIARDGYCENTTPAVTTYLLELALPAEAVCHSSAYHWHTRLIGPETPESNPVVIDLTWHQFVSNRSVTSAFPPVFVGHASEISGLLRVFGIEDASTIYEL